MNSFDTDLEARLNAIRGQGLFRQLRPIESAQGVRVQMAGEDRLNFSSNDYLGLADHPALKEAAVRAVEKFGAGSGASRLICGSLEPFHELEGAIAEFKGTETALSFSTGYAAALGTITALAGPDDIVIIDKLVHACIVDAARLSGAKLRIFAHNDLDDLERILKWATKQTAAVRAPADQASQRRVLIISESVFSMDGDIAPLREIVRLKEQHGAWLMVDEAHATGLFGLHARGVIEDLNVSNEVEVQMGTLGKALGASGGYICGSRRLIDFLVNRARSLIFSTAPVPAAAAAARAAIEVVRSAEGRTLRANLWRNVSDVRARLRDLQLNTSSPILPLMVGDETRAMDLAASLYALGFLVPAIRYPTVARGSARLRLTVSAAHTPDDIAQLMSALTTLDFGPWTLD